MLRMAAAAPVLVGMPAVVSSLTAPAAKAAGLAGAVVFLDPGHNGANDSSISKQVPTGRGGTKPCQTTGTTSVNGVPEHTFNYAVAYKLYQALTAAGAQVMLSRNDDTSVASCIERAREGGRIVRTALTSQVWDALNTAYQERLEKTGLAFTGMSPDGQLPEIVERPDHPWFVGVQFHPELKSKPFDPHPLFASFIEAAVKQSRLV